jgi:hypothetical protein
VISAASLFNLEPDVDMDPALATFQAELERVGLRVVPHRNHLCVRLPLFTSVLVRVEDGELRLQTLAGPTRSGRVMAWTAGAGTGIVGGLAFGVGLGALTLTAAVGVVALLAMELGQIVLGEGAATRLALQWMTRRALPVPVPAGATPFP